MTFCVPAAVKHQHIVKGSKFPLQSLPAAAYNGLPSGLHNMVHLEWLLLQASRLMWEN